MCKEATLKTWIKGLEEDLASKREHIKSLEIAQKELQEENEKLKVTGGQARCDADTSWAD